MAFIQIYMHLLMCIAVQMIDINNKQIVSVHKVY